ncbi:hypothetical protein JCM5350_003305, partial [Sporobolomyces pararoseus]
MATMSRLLKQLPSLRRSLSTLHRGGGGTVSAAPPPPALLPRISSLIDPSCPEFKSRQDDMKLLELELKKRLEKVYGGGGEKARERARGKGKLLVRE